MLRHLEQEKAHLDAVRTDETHVGYLLDEIVESNQIIVMLKERIAHEQSELDGIIYQRDMFRERLAGLREDKQLAGLRSELERLREELAVAKRKKRMEQLEAHTDVIELELLRYALKGENRRCLSASVS